MRATNHVAANSIHGVITNAATAASQLEEAVARAGGQTVTGAFDTNAPEQTIVMTNRSPITPTATPSPRAAAA